MQAARCRLSDIVPVLENFGFNVIEQVPTALRDIAHIHDFHLGLRGGAPTAPLFARKDVVETALTQVIDGKAENDAFNQLITIAGLEPQAVVWLRAWHRYLRQTGLNYGVPTVVAALGNNAGNRARDRIAVHRAPRPGLSRATGRPQPSNSTTKSRQASPGSLLPMKTASCA
jgi:NAD-specific glutamate dehydrogenase